MTSERAPGVGEEELAEALHDAMCTTSHHDRPPARCSDWAKYPLIAASVSRRLAAARGEPPEPGLGALSDAYFAGFRAGLDDEPTNWNITDEALREWADAYAKTALAAVTEPAGGQGETT